eukprot:scaffold4839_cov136-Isochrysis_galbana.AAC.10
MEHCRFDQGGTCTGDCVAKRVRPRLGRRLASIRSDAEQDRPVQRVLCDGRSDPSVDATKKPLVGGHGAQRKYCAVTSRLGTAGGMAAVEMT